VFYAKKQMKKNTVILIVGAVALMSSCGPEVYEKPPKRIADSIRLVDSMAMVQAKQQRIADSIAILKVAPIEIFVVAEEEPSYPGGDEARIKFLQENLKYPEEAIKRRLHGKVFVTFVVEADGALSDVKVLRGIG
jgi:hypothetical protein